MTQQVDISGLVESWTKTQQKIWNDWMETLQKSTGGGSAQQTWQQGLQRWQEAVQQTLDAQDKAMQSWAEQVGKVEGTPPEAKKWTEDGVAMVQQWTAAQRGLWEQWFNMMDKGLQGGMQPGQDQLKQFMAGWEQVNQQMQKMQKTWMAGLGGGGSKS